MKFLNGGATSAHTCFEDTSESVCAIYRVISYDLKIKIIKNFTLRRFTTVHKCTPQIFSGVQINPLKIMLAKPFKNVFLIFG